MNQIDDNIFNYDSCSICKNIPEYKFVEILHTDERIPQEIDELQIVGGNSFIGEIRKCSLCGTYYEFIHDHDSESGVGYGYTDESIRRITFTDVIKKIRKKLGGYEANFALQQEFDYLIKNNERFRKIVSKREGDKKNEFK